MALLTVGHGTLERDRLVGLLAGAGIDVLVDVRRHPASRRHPHVNRDVLAEWLPEHGITYRWEERLGGRRRGSVDSPHTAIRNASFRAYADHMDTRDWRAALTDVVGEASASTLALMCAESVWWRCHRRFIADAAVLLHDLDVVHLMHDGRQSPHEITAGARVVEDRLRYDAGGTQSGLFDG